MYLCKLIIPLSVLSSNATYVYLILIGCNWQNKRVERKNAYERGTKAVTIEVANKSVKMICIKPELVLLQFPLQFVIASPTRAVKKERPWPFVLAARRSPANFSETFCTRRTNIRIKFRLSNYKWAETCRRAWASWEITSQSNLFLLHADAKVSE